MQNSEKNTEKLKEIQVTYFVGEEKYKRLEKIAEGYQMQGSDFSPEQMFNLIMITGSEYDIDKKFKFHEWKLGFREDF